MGVIEELEDNDAGCCPTVKKVAQKEKSWDHPKFTKLKICQSEELGKYVTAAQDLKSGEVLFSESPLVVGPVQMTVPVCLECYTPVDGSFKCRRSGWPLCGPTCEKAVSKNPEVVVPAQTEGTFEIDDYNTTCYMYECVAPLRALLKQKTAPKKYKKILSLESHLKERKKSDEWVQKTKENIIGVMKKTLGIMVFEALCPEYDFSDETIQTIVGIFETNAIEIRMAQSSDVMALYETACLLEHSCIPNLHITFDKKFNITVRAGRDIKKGEHLSIMYTHSLWGSAGRREHLNSTKKFWCKCERCKDPTEFGTNFSTFYHNGQEVVQKAPLESNSPWVTKDGTVEIPAEEVADNMAQIGEELTLLQMKGSVDDYKEFLQRYSKLLHPNHYHMLTAKHSLMQMMGRTEGYLIQDMSDEMLKEKENLCREMIELCSKLDPCRVRLQIYIGVALYELHLPLLQYGKRKWETGQLPTEEFRKCLFEPRDMLLEALDLLKDETHDQLPEGQLRLQVKDTLTQLEQFMKTLGCEM